MTAKTPLYLLPGLLCDAQLWAPQVEALSDIAEIAIGDMTRGTNAAELADALLADAPSDRFALAGLSMGGYLAQEIMRRAPERVTRLALLDTTATSDTPEQTQRRKDLIDLAQRGEFKGITPRLLPMFIHEDRLNDAELVGIVESMAANIGRDAFLRQQQVIMSRVDGHADLPNVACDTLLICGRQDVLTPLDKHEKMLALLPNARLLVIEECGHLSTLERPDEVNAAMRDWLLRGVASL